MREPAVSPPAWTRTYGGATPAEAAAGFAEDAPRFFAAGYTVASQEWRAADLTVVYRLAVPVTRPQSTSRPITSEGHRRDTSDAPNAGHAGGQPPRGDAASGGRRSSSEWLEVMVTGQSVQTRTYRGQTQEETAQAFAADAQLAESGGYRPTSQVWDGVALTVVYQRYSVTPSGPMAGTVATETAASRPSRRLFAFLVLAVTFGVALAGGGFAILQTGVLVQKHPIVGSLVIVKGMPDDQRYETSGSGTSATCTGSGGYSDIQPGLPVTIKDEVGKIIGTTSLGSGSPGTDYFSGCTMSFSFDAVPDANIYSVEAGRRGAVSYTKAQLEGNGWKVAMFIGK